MAEVDFSGLQAAFETLADAVADVATAIRNPQVDNNSQTTVDALTGKLDAISGGLRGLADEENAMDNAGAVTADPAVTEPLPTTEQPSADTGAADAGAVEAQPGADTGTAEEQPAAGTAEEQPPVE